VRIVICLQIPTVFWTDEELLLSAYLVLYHVDLTYLLVVLTTLKPKVYRNFKSFWHLQEQIKSIMYHISTPIVLILQITNEAPLMFGTNSKFCHSTASELWSLPLEMAVFIEAEYPRLRNCSSFFNCSVI
jgi:hypothetical protein